MTSEVKIDTFRPIISDIIQILSIHKECTKIALTYTSNIFYVEGVHNRPENIENSKINDR